MKNITCIIAIFILSNILFSCDKETVETYSTFKELGKTKYYNSEVFSEDYLKIYGKWKLLRTSGGWTGSGNGLNFSFLEVREYGTYGFVTNDDLVEYGKIVLIPETTYDRYLKIKFEKDKHSTLFFEDSEKYIVFTGNDTLHLNSPCCDRIHYHFGRVK